VYDSGREALTDLMYLLSEEQIQIQKNDRCTICQYWHSYMEKPTHQQAEDLLDPKDPSGGICTDG
jgi:hypothetical protein